MKWLDRSIYEITVLYDFRLFELQALETMISLHLIIRQGGETAKKWNTKFKIKMSHN